MAKEIEKSNRVPKAKMFCFQIFQRALPCLEDAEELPPWRDRHGCECSEGVHLRTHGATCTKGAGRAVAIWGVVELCNEMTYPLVICYIAMENGKTRGKPCENDGL